MKEWPGQSLTSVSASPLVSTAQLCGRKDTAKNGKESDGNVNMQSCLGPAEGET